MDLARRTLDALDWPVLLEALASHARTLRGAEVARLGLLASTLAEVRGRYAAVAEVWLLEQTGDNVPVGGVHDIREPLALSLRGVVLDAEQLMAVGHCLVALDRLRAWLDEHVDDAPELFGLAAPIVVDPELRDILGRAFDERGTLSAVTFPELGALRDRITQLRGRIRRTLEDLVHGGGLGIQLQDAFYTERDGRWVVPVKQTYKRGLGIVHGTSKSGETVFVEPAQVVESTNELREAEGDLEREERRIMAGLSAMVGREAEGTELCLQAAVEIDLACARAGLGTKLKGRIPRVGTEGVVLLKQARHPVLVLRDLDVVPNELALDARTRCLVLSGPNAGGKTVALKTVGLAALMTRSGVPLATGEGSRVDLFEPVLADIGDLQSVQGDLSTFSAHLTVLKAVLEAARPGALVLLDEVGVGTDPSQGAALAQAVVETLVEADARTVVTTHYATLKALGARDPRVALGAVEVRDGQPTYRVVHGLAGESHAFAAATRIGLPPAIMTRAREVMDAGTRELTELMEQLEAERSGAATLREELAEQRRELAHQQAVLARKVEELNERRGRLQRDIASGYQARLKGQEHKLKQLVAALQRNPDMTDATELLAHVRGERERLRADTAPEVDQTPPPAADEVEEGMVVKVRTLGAKGTVSRILSGGQVEVDCGMMKLKADIADLIAIDAGGRERALARRAPVAEAPKAPTKAGYKEKRGGPQERTGSEQELRGLRSEATTCDLRGMRVDEAIEALEAFFDAQTLGGQDVVFVLHGHGTGALKTAVRRWLPGSGHARRWRPANPDEGGDAYTVVELQ